MVSPAILERLTCVCPTAQASVGLLALTAARLAVFPAVAGALTCDQAVPFQLSMTGFAPTPLSSAFSLPTAQASEVLTALTPDRTAFCRSADRHDGPASSRKRRAGDEHYRG